jgi:hypothetical protein
LLRSTLADAADYGYCASHSRFFWGFRLHAIFAPDGTPRAVTLASPKRDEREVALELLAHTRRQGTVTLIGDKGYAGKTFAKAVSEMNATILRPRRKDEPGKGPTPRADPPTHREHLLELQGNPHPRAPRARTLPASESASCNASSPSPPPAP